MTPSRRSSTRSLLWGLWVVITLGWLLALALGAVLSGAASCELMPGSSIYGHADWRLARLGTVCVYDLEQPAVRLVEAPSLRWPVTVLLLLWGLTLKRWRATGSSAAAPAPLG